MICLLAAVHEETTLIRQAIEGPAEQTVNGVPVITGNLLGQQICLAHSGIGKAAAAATCATLLSSRHLQAVWLFGCGGAYPDSGLTLGDLALAEEEIFGDEGVETAKGFEDLSRTGIPMRRFSGIYFNSWPIDQELYEWAKPHLEGCADRAKKKLACGPFVTVSTCTGTMTKAEEIAERTGGICENMEGAAVALTCRQMRVPLLEVRGISNQVEDRDTSRWDLDAGMTAAQNAILNLLQVYPGLKS